MSDAPFFSHDEDLSTQSYRAWLLDLGNDIHAAVANHEMSRIVLSPAMFDIPLAPVHCHSVIVEEDEIYPVADIGAFLTGKSTVFPAYESTFIGISVYQTIPGEPLEYAGIRLRNTPSIITVSDEQACELPDNYPNWAHIALSCFSHQNKPVPILDLPALFATNLQTAA